MIDPDALPTPAFAEIGHRPHRTNGGHLARDDETMNGAAAAKPVGI